MFLAKKFTSYCNATYFWSGTDTRFCRFYWYRGAGLGYLKVNVICPCKSPHWAVDYVCTGSIPLLTLTLTIITSMYSSITSKPLDHFTSTPPWHPQSKLLYVTCTRLNTYLLNNNEKNGISHQIFICFAYLTYKWLKVKQIGSRLKREIGYLKTKSCCSGSPWTATARWQRPRWSHACSPPPFTCRPATAAVWTVNSSPSTSSSGPFEPSSE